MNILQVFCKDLIKDKLDTILKTTSNRVELTREFVISESEKITFRDAIARLNNTLRHFYSTKSYIYSLLRDELMEDELRGFYLINSKQIHLFSEEYIEKEVKDLAQTIKKQIDENNTKNIFLTELSLVMYIKEKPYAHANTLVLRVSRDKKKITHLQIIRYEPNDYKYFDDIQQKLIGITISKIMNDLKKILGRTFNISVTNQNFTNACQLGIQSKTGDTNCLIYTRFWLYIACYLLIIPECTFFPDSFDFDSFLTSSISEKKINIDSILKWSAEKMYRFMDIHKDEININNVIRKMLQKHIIKEGGSVKYIPQGVITEIHEALKENSSREYKQHTSIRLHSFMLEKIPRLHTEPQTERFLKIIRDIRTRQEKRKRKKHTEPQMVITDYQKTNH